MHIHAIWVQKMKNETKSVISVRDASPSELQEMLALTLEAYDEYRPDCPDDFWVKYVRNITEAVTEAPDIERIVAICDGKMAGSVLLCKKSFMADEPEIRLLAVSPRFRQRGVAAELMAECERRLKARGHRTVVLHTTHLMDTARRMYERSGYVRLEALDFKPVPSFTVWGFSKILQ
jgi:ribosomal protein S18 acetylase RimI-like enzyme